MSAKVLPPAPSKLALAQLPTPLQPLDRLSAQLGGPRIWIKRDDLTHSAMTGNKLRKLEYLCAEAQQHRADTLITCGGLQSNHCRATALVAAQLGMRCHLILRGRQPQVLDGNTLLSHLAGAQLSFYPPSQWSQLSSYFDYWSAYYRERGCRPYCIPTGASNELGLWGYISAAQELHSDLQTAHLDPDCIVCATGSGGTHTGLALGLHFLRPQTPVRAYAVCDDRVYFEEKGQSDIALWHRRFAGDGSHPLVHLDINEHYIGPGYGKAEAPVFASIAQLARSEGIVLDPVYTGKAFHGMLDQIMHGDLRDMANVVFVHTGGLFGLFPYRDKFGLTPDAF